MPIKPENRKLYPANWKEIRARILERDGHRCKFCGVENHDWGMREVVGENKGVFIVGGKTADEAADELYRFLGEDSPYRLIQIVLTIAHLHDMNPANCADDNLAALCQRCHNAHDREYRQRNAKATRAAKRDAAAGQPALFTTEQTS